jgi:hypothetical protein
MQLALPFEVPETPDPFGGTKHPRNPCTPGRVGSGEPGESCGTCKHRRRLHSLANSRKSWNKCGLMERHWTGGEGTDIKCAWAACPSWESEIDLREFLRGEPYEPIPEELMYTD